MSQNPQHIHIIAIGGAVMSSLAVALKKKGLDISGSDDKIYDPAATLLAGHDLIPNRIGWDTDTISDKLDAVIVGMHAKGDNPELKKAKEIGLKIWSYPEFIRSQSEHKQRVVIAGSHGKTTITGMVIHVLNYWNRSFDFLLGAKIKGMEETIRLSDAPIIIIEGDEYFTSPLDPQPKFLKYDHHVALISGTAWDHINVYPTLESYVSQFDKLAEMTPKAGSLIYCEEDSKANEIGAKERADISSIPYGTPKYKIEHGVCVINKNVKLKVFGKHNMQNLEGARKVLDRVGISKKQFYEAIGSFEGAYKRNNVLAENGKNTVYLDFAHAPSKLHASSNALKEHHKDRKVTACYELHTFSSLKKEFLHQYKDKFNAPDEAIVYFDQKLVIEKGYEQLSEDDIKDAFNRNDIKVFTDTKALEAYLKNKTWNNEDLLFMSSGTFGGLDIQSIAEHVTN